MNRINDIIRIAVCDDAESDRRLLIGMLEEYFDKNRLLVEINMFSSGEELLQSDTSVYLLVFFDIYMGGMTGVDAARALKERHPECAVIFTTTSREHGADAFDLDAFHYLVKPVEPYKLFSVLNKWYDALCKIRTVTLKSGRSSNEIFIRDILYIDVLGRNSTVHTVSETIETACSLSALEELLPVGEFIRPIRYCLVALRHITIVGEETIILSNSDKIPISRRERENIRQQLAAYRLRALRRR